MTRKNSTFIDTNGEEETSLGEGRRYEHRKMMFTDIKEDQTLTHDWESPKDGVTDTKENKHTRVLTGY